MGRDVALDAGARPDALIASGLAVPGCGRTPAGVRSRSQPEHFAGRATLAETRRQRRAASAIVPASASSAASSARPPRP